ncbi:hypothetical protein O181_060364 [Austropuccinia psidii MF-1]|uniref:Uncharacterized protein n=1 Tax=Austropuccinia psidii MF-1 TaxID=1389203 RepID=A0A9Q3EG50_9BASI|nr:hypothetical protein [Austropuccinia psidii MF-1]
MLTYLALHTRPNIAFTVNLLLQHVNPPTVTQWQVVKHFLHYLCGTMSTGIKFTKNNSSVRNLVRWANADYGDSVLTKKLTSGFVVTLYGNPISWCTKKQPIVAQSTTKAEFVAINKRPKQLRLLSMLLTSIGLKSGIPTILNDNRGAVFITEGAQLNPNSKNIEIRFQYVRDMVKRRLLNISHVPSTEMIANILTKPLGTIKLHEQKRLLNMVETVHVKGG